jgi:hypothetical protein
MEERTHVDLEVPFRLSADVEFSFSENNFEQLPPLDLEIKKKETRKIEIQNVELRNSTSKRGLF